MDEFKIHIMRVGRPWVNDQLLAVLRS